MQVFQHIYKGYDTEEMKAQDIDQSTRPVSSSAEQLRQEEQISKTLLEEGQLYQTIWNHSLAGMYLIQDGTYQLVSPIAATFMGYSIPELVGRKSASIIHPEDRKKARNHVKEMLSGQLNR